MNIKVLILAAVFGILLGAALIIYTAVNRGRLPAWAVVIFSVTGFMIIAACVLMFAGLSVSGD